MMTLLNCCYSVVSSLNIIKAMPIGVIGGLGPRPSSKMETVVCGVFD